MLLVASLALLSLVAPSTDAASMRAGHRCCVADQWHGHITFSLVTIPGDGSPTTVNQASGLLDQDWTLKRVRFVVSGIVRPGDYRYNFTEYEDYVMKKKYTILQNGNCTSEDLKLADPFVCIPGNFVYGGRTTLGSGDESLHADIWSGADGTFNYSMSVTTNDCTPVTLSRFGSDEKGSYVVTDFTYTNVVSESLSSQDALVIPEKCLHPQGAMAVGK